VMAAARALSAELGAPAGHDRAKVL
jgi:hypothetical protein